MTLSDENHESIISDGVVYADSSAREILQPYLDDIRKPDGCDRWEKVKSNSSRTVYRGTIAQQAVYLKCFHRRSIFYRILRCIGFSDAMREFNVSIYLSSHNVETPSVLAAQSSGGVEWVITSAVEPSITADEWHAEKLTEGASGRMQIQQTILSVADLVAKMHGAGIFHHDLHCANILLREGDDGVEPVLTDLHRTSKKCRLGRAKRAANLAQILHDRYDFTTRTERLRFLCRYLQTSGANGTLSGWTMLVEDFAQWHRKKQYAGRDKRIFRKDKYFSPVKLSGGWRGNVVLASKRCLAGSNAAKMEFKLDEWKNILKNPAELFEHPDVEIIKDSASSLVVRRRLTIGGHEVDVYLKRSRRKRFSRIFVDCFRPSRSKRAFALGHTLLARRIATALPLAALEKRSGIFLRDNILITESADGIWLHNFLETYLAAPPRSNVSLTLIAQHQLAQEVLWQLGRLLQHLHDNNFSHRDLKATNVLVRWSPGTPPELVLVDLDGLKRTRCITMRRRLQGLMRLNVSLLKCPTVNRSGRLRMLLGYLRRPGDGRINFKSYWRVLEEWSKRKLDQQIRSRRKRQKQSRRPS